MSTNQREQDAGELYRAAASFIKAVVTAVERSDPSTASHQRRVTKLVEAIAKEMRLSGDRIETLRVASQVHDVGKIFIPGEILLKPGKVDKFERAMINDHPRVGFHLLKDVRLPWPIAEIVHQHHERLDGSGYPQQLRGQEIVLEARILAVADVVEAVSSPRPYRPALGVDSALEEISRNKGRLFDPEVVDACLAVFSKGRFGFD
jgi:HD-GYP domain-containing protein (c-di-GMP phosphodiesterase class II)